MKTNLPPPDLALDAPAVALANEIRAARLAKTRRELAAHFAAPPPPQNCPLALAGVSGLGGILIMRHRKKNAAGGDGCPSQPQLMSAAGAADVDGGEPVVLKFYLTGEDEN